MTTDTVCWVAFFATVRIGGAIPITFHVDGDHVVAEAIVPYVEPEPRASDPAPLSGKVKIPLRFAEGFPVPISARIKLPAYTPDDAAAFVRDIARQIYLHELDEQLRIDGARPFHSHADADHLG